MLQKEKLLSAQWRLSQKKLVKNSGPVILMAAMLMLLNISTAAGDDIDTLRIRLREEYLTGSAWNAETYLGSQQANGSWSDIDYANTSRTAWAPNGHLSRLRRMAIAFANPSNANFGSPEMLAGVSTGLDYWYTRKPVSDNWWYNDIGQQLELGPILIIMRDNLSAAQVDTGCHYLNDPQATGQNLVWYAQQTVQRGCLQHTQADITLGLDAIAGEVRVTIEEGIQPDFSFHQHGPQLYSGGYGRGFVNDVSYWMYMSRGLSFSFSTDKVDILSGLILDGTQWMVRRGYLDMACQGREVTRPNSQNASGLSGALGRMAALETPRQTEFNAFAAHLTGDHDGNVTGNRHFWRVDYQAHRRPGYHVSVKMCSRRTNGTEYMNNENKKGYYLPFGSTAILRNGDEYYNLFPVWDWARVPGVTCPYKNPPPQMTTYIKGTTDFAGGVSDGTYGAAALDLDWDGVTGRKAWFYFDREFVALGAGITGEDAEPVQTSINQCFLRGDVWAAEDDGPGTAASTGAHALVSPKWVWHDSVGYVFPGSGNVQIKNDSQSGSWQSVNDTYSADVLTENVFSLWFDHGAVPSGASYEYIVVPGADRPGIRAYAQSSGIRIISNTADLQAVRDDSIGVTGLVFYTSGKVNVHGDLSFSVDQPCMALVRESAGDVSVSLSNPAGGPLTVLATLEWRGAPVVSLTFELPEGGEAGNTVTQAVPWSSGVNALPGGETAARLDLVKTVGGAVVRFSLSRRSHVLITLVRADGAEALTLVDGIFGSGKYERPLDPSNPAPGAYMVRMRVGDVESVRKVELR